MATLKRVYNLLPPPVADAVLSAYGVRNVARLRAWNRIIAATAPTETWSEASQLHYTASRLRTILEHAFADVPRYRKYSHLAKELAGDDRHVIELTRCLPAIAKEEILEDPSAFLSRRVPRWRCATTHTSGTTGTPLAVHISRSALLASDAFWWRRTVWAGYEKGDVIARLVGDPVVPLQGPWSNVPVRRSWSDARLYLSTFHLNRHTARMMQDAVQRTRPAFVMGYPSALSAWARLVESPVATSAWRPKAVLCSSEPLYSHQREAIESAFQAPIRGLYGCAERVLSASECEHGSLHLTMIDGYLEGQFSFENAPGGSYVSGLLNEAMPLIRYDLGDTLRIRRGRDCPCGRTLPVLDPVVTKAEDFVVTPSGRWISPSALTWAFKEIVGLRKSQIVQRSVDRLDVLVEIDEWDYVAAATELENRLRELTFGEMDLRIRKADRIPLTHAGKTRFVVNECVQAAQVRPGHPKVEHDCSS